jgi:hypothetical protein
VSGGIWTYRTDIPRNVDLAGFSVHAIDADIGTVDDVVDEDAGAYLVVDTGGWFHGRKIILPAGLVERVDGDARMVVVDRTKEQIENAPDYSPERGDPGLADQAIREAEARAGLTARHELGTYYGGDPDIGPRRSSD